MIQEKLLVQEETITKTTSKIIVWNDDVNSFEWVIDCFMEILGHTAEQAEQCAWFIHIKGKYAVKMGEAKKLRPLKDALLDRGLSATIEED